jgi:hypothetical protein
MLENIKHLFLLITHESLPTYALCLRSHLNPNSTCKMCHALEESLIHLFRDYPFPMAIWDGVPFSTWNLMYITQLLDWFVEHDTSSNGIVYIVICWVNWQDWNNMVSNDDKWTIQHCLNEIHSYTAIFLYVLSTSTTRNCCARLLGSSFFKAP